MTDLLFGILLMLLLAAGLFILVLRLIRDWPVWIHVCLALAAVALGLGTVLQDLGKLSQDGHRYGGGG